MREETGTLAGEGSHGLGGRVWAPLITLWIVWGTTYLGTAAMVQSMPPLLGAGARYVVGAAVLAAGIFLVPDLPKASAAKSATASAPANAPTPAGEPATAPTATSTPPPGEIPLDAIGLSAPAAKPKNAAEERRDTRRVIRFVGNAVALPLAWWLLAAQRRRFRIAEQCHAPTGKLLLPGLLAFGVNFAISFALAFALTALKRA